MAYTLIGHPQSRAMRAMWMLEEAGQSYDLIPAKPASDEAKAHNPSGKVPALKVDGQLITDSVAIVQFLADRHGVGTAKAGTVARGQQDALTQFVVEEIDGALWTASKHKFVLPEALRVPQVKETARVEFDRAIARLSAYLGEQDYLMGDAFCVPDLIASHCLGWARAAKFDVTDERVVAYGKRCRARPAFRRALERAAETRA
ncbi:glutathione S-transferase [Rubricella aquisinus]|uniref:Glutathione S-transferase n=1 Tax=Rubricella aquisinus TaxID=2028108 RepID=A0A840X523_9RHOB|nr:glutathione S-transferase family protein [Rubricella aquisinus]MBB5516935.1 glutathione S-transferase [Rubricella aquisinus]